jgi:hypothetical protein
MDLKTTEATRKKAREMVLAKKNFFYRGVSNLLDDLNSALAEVSEMQASSDLRWKADMRAIKRWQKAHPGNDLVWPDHADLCVWLMEQLKHK